jgi:cytochrome P450
MAGDVHVRPRKDIFEPEPGRLAMLGRERLDSRPLPGTQAWMIVRYEDTRFVLNDRRFSSEVNGATLAPSGRSAPGWFFGLDDPEHARYRKVITRYLTWRQAKLMEAKVTAVAGEILSALEQADPPADLFAGFAWPFAGQVIIDLLGISRAEDAEFRRVLEESSAPDVPAAERFTARWEVMRDIAARRVREPGDGLIDAMLAGEPGPVGGLSVDETASIALGLRLGGHSPVAHVIAMTVLLVLTADVPRDRFTGAPALADETIDEFLRYLPTNNSDLIRVATADVELRDSLIRAGDIVFVSLPVANRDPRRFGCPADLNLDRGFSPHVSFGSGVHQCMGKNLARVELRVALRELLRRFPSLRVAVDPRELRMEDSAEQYGVTELPVTWLAAI